MSRYVKDNLVADGDAFIRGFTFFNWAADPINVSSYTVNKGAFYFNTVSNTLKIYDTAWKFIPNVTASLINQQLMVGNGFNLLPITAPAQTSFVKVNTSSVASTSQYIAFADINPLAYTTTITAPGLNTWLPTEKAVVDYIANTAIQDNILAWNGSKYTPYTVKKIADPGFAYFYNYGTGKPSYNNAVSLDGMLEVTAINTANSILTEYVSGLTPNYLSFDYGYTGYNITAKISLSPTQLEIQALRGNGLDTAIPIVIGGFAGNTNNEHIIIDDDNQLFDINMTTIKLSKGTASKWLSLDVNKEITYNDPPTSAITSVQDGMWDLDTTAGVLTISPYTVRTKGAFYTDYITPAEPNNAGDILSFSGVFRATRLFEGLTRVMTVHGVQASDGTMHSLSTTTNAGFLLALPTISPTTRYLRGDNTWANVADINFWKRVSTTISPTTANDILSVSSNVAGASITGIGTIGTGVYGQSTSAAAVQGSSDTGIGVYGTSQGDVGGRFHRNSTSLNTSLETLKISRDTTGTAANGIGAYTSYYIESSGGILRSAGQIHCILTNATNASEASSFEWWLADYTTDGVGKRMSLTHQGKLNINSLTINNLLTYADNTAALAGGLTAGMVYRTSTGGLMITY
jgi:hypothetical protein